MFAKSSESSNTDSNISRTVNVIIVVRKDGCYYSFFFYSWSYFNDLLKSCLVRISILNTREKNEKEAERCEESRQMENGGRGSV